MKTLSDPARRAECCRRIALLAPEAKGRWGKMSVHQMVCHLNDSFRVCVGEQKASPASNLFSRNVMKFMALRVPLPWPHGIPTRPELDQVAGGGTPPAEWVRDCAELQAWIERFGTTTAYAAHPTFGEMGLRDWRVWGYLHVDHHLRQFGV
ncbi:MAG: DUF1569 domain-containing protein [Bryobacteraceae bacterium]